jgi:hypothetical protein
MFNNLFLGQATNNSNVPTLQPTNAPLYATGNMPASPSGTSPSGTSPSGTSTSSGTPTVQTTLGLPSFEISSAPFNLPNYPLSQDVANAAQNIYEIGWVNLNFAGLTDYYQGTINNSSFTLIDTQITSSQFFITDIETNYYSPDYGFNNYTILINGSPVPSFTNFRNNKPKHNSQGYYFQNAARFTMTVSSITGLIQPVMVTIIGYGSIGTAYADGVSNTLSSLQILI